MSENLDQMLRDTAIKNYQGFLAIASFEWDTWIAEYMKFLKHEAEVLELQHKVYTLQPRKAIVVLVWPGRELHQPAILLNSGVDANGIQYIEVIRRLKHEKFTPKRTLYLHFVLEEYVRGGQFIMYDFVCTKEFENMNIGFSLGPGIPSTIPQFYLFNEQRSIWKFHVHCIGDAGPASKFIPNTAAEKLTRFLVKLHEFRLKEDLKMKNTPSVTLGDTITINITNIHGDIDSGAFPTKFSVAVTCFLPTNQLVFGKFMNLLDAWCAEAGPKVSIEYQLQDLACPTILDNNPYWTAFKRATDELNLVVKVQTLACRTGNEFLRRREIPVLEFTPVNNYRLSFKPVGRSVGNDYGVEKFLQGIEIYKKIVTSITEI